MKTTPKQSDLDIYINDIVDKLRAKYNYVDKNRLKNSVRFCYHYGATYKGIRDNYLRVVEIKYVELDESIRNNTYPNKILKLL